MALCSFKQRFENLRKYSEGNNNAKILGIDIDIKPETVNEENVVQAEAPKEEALKKTEAAVEAPKEETSAVETSKEEPKSESPSEKK